MLVSGRNIWVAAFFSKGNIKWRGVWFMWGISLSFSLNGSQRDGGGEDSKALRFRLSFWGETEQREKESVNSVSACLSASSLSLHVAQTLSWRFVSHLTELAHQTGECGILWICWRSVPSCSSRCPLQSHVSRAGHSRSSFIFQFLSNSFTSIILHRHVFVVIKEKR